MLCYNIIKGKDKENKVNKRRTKIGKKHGYKDGRMIIIDNCITIGYF